MSLFVKRALAGQLPGKSLDGNRPAVRQETSYPFAQRVITNITAPITVDSTCGSCHWLFSALDEPVRSGSRFVHPMCMPQEAAR